MFERFALANQKLGLNHFGMGCYGCCEPLDNRYEAVFRHITNLRRISVSPWSDIKLAAEKIGKKTIFSWKPNPAMISSSFDETAVTKLLEYVKQTAAGCHLEIILKDLRTCGNTNQYIKHFIALTDRVFDRPAAGKDNQHDQTGICRLPYALGQGMVFSKSTFQMMNADMMATVDILASNPSLHPSC